MRESSVSQITMVAAINVRSITTKLCNITAEAFFVEFRVTDGRGRSGRGLSAASAGTTSSLTRCSRPLYRAVSHPHSHSIVLGHGNALIFQRKFFLRMRENRLHDPLKICALEFKGEFRRSGIWSVSATIDIDWPIFPLIAPTDRQPATTKKAVTRLPNTRARDQTCARQQCHSGP